MTTDQPDCVAEFDDESYTRGYAAATCDCRACCNDRAHRRTEIAEEEGSG